MGGPPPSKSSGASQSTRGSNGARAVSTGAEAAVMTGVGGSGASNVISRPSSSIAATGSRNGVRGDDFLRRLAPRVFLGTVSCSAFHETECQHLSQSSITISQSPDVSIGRLCRVLVLASAASDSEAGTGTGSGYTLPNTGITVTGRLAKRS